MSSSVPGTSETPHTPLTPAPLSIQSQTPNVSRNGAFITRQSSQLPPGSPNKPQRITQSAGHPRSSHSPTRAIGKQCMFSTQHEK